MITNNLTKTTKGEDAKPKTSSKKEYLPNE